MRRKRLIILILLNVIMISVYFLLFPLKSPTENIERKLAASLPASASMIKAQVGSGILRIGRSFYLEISLPTQDALDFMNQICDDEIFDTQYNGRANDRHVAWPDWFLKTPEAISISSYCVVEDTGAYLDVFVDMHHPERYMIYIRGIG
jgi:hypothetical protein